MNNKKQINQEMRSILINWLLEVQNLIIQNKHYFYSLIDSFKKILRSENQLIGITCLFIVCKHEEIELPNSKDFLQKRIIQRKNYLIWIINFKTLLIFKYNKT